MDIATISAALGSIKIATEIAKFIGESSGSLEKAEFKLKLADLISNLADAKIKITEIQQTLLDKDAELRKLREQLSIKGKLNWEPPYYWVIDEGRKDGPYCQQCYDKNHELIRLQDYYGDGSWECMTCKNTYLDSRHKGSIGSENDDYDPLTFGLRRK
jgi:hypothetical protein